MKKNPGWVADTILTDQEPWERWQHLDRKSDEYKAGPAEPPGTMAQAWYIYTYIYIYLFL